MKKVVFISWHYFNSQRKAGFHFLAKAFSERGYDVVFVASVVSIFTFLRKEQVIYEEGFKQNLFKKKKFGTVNSLINFSLFRPPISRKSKTLEFLAHVFFRLNRKSIKEIRNADYIVFECGHSVLFFDKVKSINPKAKIIYRMSDDMELLKVSKKTVEYERSILHKFNIVSVPTQLMFDKFSIVSPRNTKLHFHGIDKQIYDNCKNSPYLEKINLVFVGNSHMDVNFVDIASSLFEDYYFHIIGGFEPLIKKPNVMYYGRMPFEKTIPYVKFASIGLQIRSNEDGIATSLSDSLKVIQYSYCNLPIIAPDVIPAHHRKNFFYYNYDNKESIKKSIEQALNFNKNSQVPIVNSWEEIALELIESA